MNKNELLIYEIPAIAEYISIGFLQTIIARYIAWKIKRKLRRYEHRKFREKFFKDNPELIKDLIKKHETPNP